ncbi:MAG: LysR family transcriptional regulator [Lachnospiraceae bacterium]|nr:LysR family transcriptional regulator [Lachnospiraceae bacterium]
MNIKNLEYFVTIAKYENISKAAEKLYVAQPALSKYLSDLEKELGYKLFDRNGKNIKLNQNGEIYLQYAKNVLQESKNVLTHLQEQNDNFSKKITFGVSVCSQLLGDILSEFHNMHPEVQMYIITGYPLDFDSNNLDLIIDCDTSTPDNTIPLMTEKLKIAMPKEKHFSYKKIYEESLSGKQSLIIPSKHTSLGQVLLKYYYEDIKKQTDSKHFYTPLIVNNSFVQCDLVEKNIGISVVPEKTWKSIYSTKNIVLKEINPPITRDIFLRINPNKYKTKIIDEFVKYLKNYFKNL